nr:SpaA isopeptide-forming pilin-related protein [Bacillus sp. FJAT-50079]
MDVINNVNAESQIVSTSDQEDLEGGAEPSESNENVVEEEGAAEDSVEEVDKPVTTPENNEEKPIEGEEAEVSNEEEEIAEGQAPDVLDEEVVDGGAELETFSTIAAASVIENNILTDYQITLSENGQEVESAGPETIVSISYNWAIPNGHNYKEGSTFTFQVPPELDVYNTLNREEMKDYSGNLIGYFSVNDSGQATIEFTKYIEEHSNLGGSLQIITELHKELVIDDDKVTVTPIQGEASHNIPINYRPGGPSVEKSGKVDRAYNAEKITWTVDFNKTLEALQNAVLNDPIQDGQTLKEGTIKLYHLVTRLNGTVELGEQVDPSKYTIGETANGKDFAIQFNEEIKSAYRVVFETDITDGEKTTFENKATLTSDNGPNRDGTASVTTKRGLPLAKKASHYDAKTQTITWEIYYNYNEKAISQANAILSDLFNGSQELIADSFVVHEMSIDKDGNATEKAEFNNFGVTSKSEGGKNGFDFQFKQDISAAYKIVYKTKASDRVFDGEEEIINDVTYDGKTVQGTQPIGQQILFKSHGKPNYKDKTIEWTITFNHDNYEMKNVILTDIFTNAGLTLDPSSIVISNSKRELTSPADYTIVPQAGDQFEIHFNGEITEAHTIKYKTSFDYEQRTDKTKNYLQNKAELEWVDENNNRQEKSATANFTPDTYTQANGFKNGSYNAVDKEITWNIGVNYNLKPLENASVTDFIQGNQKLMKDSITVYKMSLTGGENGTKQEELVAGKDYTINFIDDEDGNPGFKVNLGKINEPYLITYKTSLKDLSFVADKYDNEATLADGNTKETDLHASVPIPHGGSYTKKDGKQNGKIAEWTVNINFAQAKITKAVITDMPNENHVVLEDSIQLFATTVQQNGQVSKGELLKEGKDYTIEFNEEQTEFSFKLTFSNEINEPYILEYQSFILRIPSTVSNQIALAGESVEPGKEGSKAEFQSRVTSGSAVGTGEVGRLQITKIDQASGIALEGAIFALKDPESGIVVKRGTTDENGVLVFSNLLWGDYLLIEEEAPEGYLAKSEPIEVTIDQAFVEGDPEKLGNVKTIHNQKIIRAVQLEKVDSNDSSKKLEGANFQLLKKVGDQYVSNEILVTNEDGLIYIEGLEPGEYQFIELIAPNGYHIDKTPIPFTIGENQLEVLKIGPITNEIIKGGVELTKVDKDNNQIVLENAVFKLLDEDGNVLQENLTTDEHGKIKVDDLYPGTYQFVETKAPLGYKLNQTPISFTIVTSQNVVVEKTAVNELIKGSVILTKFDEDQSEVKLEGAVFELQDENGKVIQRGISTNADGEILVENLTPGKYQFVETKAPIYYQLDPSPITFEVERGENEVAVVVTALNKLITGSVQLTKVDKDDNRIVIPEAKFELQDVEGNVIQTELKTDENGKIIVENLKPGKYQFIETEAPFGYELNPTPIPFEIVKSATEADVKTVEITAENELTPGSVELTKVDEADSSITLSGAVFKLLDEDGNVIHEELTTDDEGKIIVDQLKPGNYQLIEIAAPEFYQLDPTPVEFTIEKGENLNAVSVQASNQLITGSVQLTKVDKDDNRIVIPEAKFELQDAEGNVIQTELKTDENGKIIVENLKPGKYQFIETGAPFGYELNPTPIPFEIVKSATEADVKTVEVTAENELTPGSVELTKVDEADSSITLSGAVFKLLDEDGNVIHEELTTDDEGKIIVDQLKPGNYQLIEIAAPEFYQLDPTPVEFTIEKGENLNVVSVQATNQLITGSVQLTKVDKDDHSLVVPNAEFELQDADGDIIQSGLVTDEEGKLVVENLKPGAYQFVETKAPFGYELDTTAIPFIIEKSATVADVKIVLLQMENELTTGSVELTKVDDDDPTITLEGAVFKLEDKEGNVIAENLVTDADGKIIVDQLKPGQYTFIETEAPFGYDLDPTPIEFTIDRGQSEPLQLSTNNRLTTGSVELMKVDREDHERILEGAVFTLLDADGQVVKENLTTNADGKIIVEELKPGSYQFVETKAPFGYKLDPTPIVFTIDKGQTEARSITFTNDLITGSVELIKVDSEDSTITLSGAVFNLLDEVGNIIAEGLTTDEAGKIIVNHLKPGNYQFVEIKAPTNYILDQTPLAFEIVMGQNEKIQIIKANTRELVEKPVKPEEPTAPNKPDKQGSGSGNKTNVATKLPQTGEQLFSYMIALGAMLVVLGGIILLRQRKRV